MHNVCNMQHIYICCAFIHTYVHICTHMYTCVYVCIYAHTSAWTIHVITEKNDCISKNISSLN